MHQDQLGSASVLTDENGVVVERLAYEPWGKRRQTNGIADMLDALAGQKTYRGYTMREHLDEVGIIHMNGRIYAPLIGRFNPLKGFDPTGLMLYVYDVSSRITGGAAPAAANNVDDTNRG